MNITRPQKPLGRTRDCFKPEGGAGLQCSLTEVAAGTTQRQEETCKAPGKTVGPELEAGTQKCGVQC
jgi:hypothetical protein